ARGEVVAAPRTGTAGHAVDGVDGLAGDVEDAQGGRLSRLRAAGGPHRNQDRKDEDTGPRPADYGSHGDTSRGIPRAGPGEGGPGSSHWMPNCETRDEMRVWRVAPAVGGSGCARGRIPCPERSAEKRATLLYGKSGYL